MLRVWPIEPRSGTSEASCRRRVNVALMIIMGGVSMPVVVVDMPMFIVGDVAARPLTGH